MASRKKKAAFVAKKRRAKKDVLAQVLEEVVQEENTKEASPVWIPAGFREESVSEVKPEIIPLEQMERPDLGKAVKVSEENNDLQEEGNKVSKKLLEAVSSLTKSMDISNKKKGDGPGLKSWMGGKVSSIKEMFSVGGALKMAGIGHDPSTLMGSILAGREAKKEAEEAEFQQRATGVSDILQFTERGRELAAKNEKNPLRATLEANKLYDERTGIEEKIEILKMKRKRAGDIGGSLSEEDAKTLRSLEDRKESMFKSSEPEVVISKKRSKKTEFLDGVLSGMKEEVASMAPGERDAINKMDPTFLKEVLRSAFEEVKEINEDQLEELIKLVKLNSLSEEDRLEESLKKKSGVNVVEKKEEKKKEGGILDFLKGNPFGGLMDAVKGIIPAFGLLGSGITSVVRILGPLAAVAAAGYAGYKIGGALNDNVINPAVAKLTGRKDETLGGAIADVGHERAMKQQTRDYIYAKINKGERLSPTAFKDALDLGIEVPIENVPKTAIGKTPVTDAPDNVRGDRKVMRVDEPPVTVEKVETPIRVQQMESLDRVEIAVEKVVEARSTPTTNNQTINAPSTVISNSKISQTARAPVRNQESSINRRMGYLLVGA